MNRLKGFTLAEVLITLAIIGVIASVTLPALSVNIQKQQVGPTLAKAINTLETANGMLIQQEGLRDMASLCTTRYLECLVNNNILAGTRVSSVPTYYKYDNSNFSSISNATVGYTTKDGITFYSPLSWSRSDSYGTGTKHSGKFYTVYVDINGPTKHPNKIGRDLFLFYVDTKGTVIPYGGSLYKDYFHYDSIRWNTYCNQKEVKDGSYCSGSVVDNGFKVIYPY